MYSKEFMVGFMIHCENEILNITNNFLSDRKLRNELIESGYNMIHCDNIFSMFLNEISKLISIVNKLES